MSVLSPPLDYREAYPCPLCRRGQISGLALTEAFGCVTCNHIFTANLERQSVQLADSSPPLTWRWQGDRWQVGSADRDRLGWEVWLVAIAFTLLPPTIVGTMAYLFPPLPDSGLQWFPIVWTGMTFLAHFSLVAWLILEYYQIPVLLYWQTRQLRWRSRLTRFVRS